MNKSLSSHEIKA